MCTATAPAQLKGTVLVILVFCNVLIGRTSSCVCTLQYGTYRSN